MAVVTQNIVLRSSVQGGEGIDSPQDVLKLFRHDAPTTALRKPLQPVLERTLNRLGKSFARFPGNPPSEAISIGVLYAKGHVTLCFHHSIPFYKIIYPNPRSPNLLFCRSSSTALDHPPFLLRDSTSVLSQENWGRGRNCLIQPA